MRWMRRAAVAAMTGIALVGAMAMPAHAAPTAPAATASAVQAVQVAAVAGAAPLDRRCRTGRVMCVDKSSRSLRWVVNGTVRMRFDARFGGPSTPTREGSFRVFRKSRNHVSSLFGSPMPFAMFFSGGQAVHYSADFAARGYNGASHGCVNIRAYAKLGRLFDRVRIGDKVVVYWS